MVLLLMLFFCFVVVIVVGVIVVVTFGFFDQKKRQSLCFKHNRPTDGRMDGCHRSSSSDHLHLETQELPVADLRMLSSHFLAKALCSSPLLSVPVLALTIKSRRKTSFENIADLLTDGLTPHGE